MQNIDNLKTKKSRYISNQYLHISPTYGTVIKIPQVCQQNQVASGKKQKTQENNISILQQQNLQFSSKENKRQFHATLHHIIQA